MRHLSLSSPLCTVTSVTGPGPAGVGGEGEEAASFFPFPAILPPTSAAKTKKTAKRRDAATDASATGGANAGGTRADAADPATPAYVHMANMEARGESRAAALTPREKRREEAEKRREESRRDKAAAAEAFALRSYATPKLAARAAGWRT